MALNGNGKMIARIIESLVIAGIVGALSIWGNSQVTKERISNLCASFADFKAEVRASFSDMDDKMQKIDDQIQKVDDKIYRHVQRDPVRQ